ncbi:MAG: phosphatidylserine decarboxylase [Kiritimatiellae bacterium]|nr:phosphatidylserine decarboxylase [Kiritimatiellia bacterium]
MEPIEFIERRTGSRMKESVLGDRALRFAYETMLGRTLWPLLFGSRFCSAVLGLKYGSRFSRKAIAKLASTPGCRAEEAEKPLSAYRTFNEFFTRRLRPGLRPVGEGLVSPADGRLILHLDADASAPFPLKGATRSLAEVFSPSGAPDIAGGRCDIAVIRLAPVDYHRFHFPLDCKTPSRPVKLRGRYDSVNPVALLKRPDIYAMNERMIVRCETPSFPFWMVDVGAFGVGTIVQTYEGESHSKGDEKGYFKFGGSTVIMVFPAGKVAFDADLVANSASGCETRVFCMEKIGSV